MSSLTQQAFFKALIDKFDASELVDLLGLSTADIVDAFEWIILNQQAELEDELKWSR